MANESPRQKPSAVSLPSPFPSASLGHSSILSSTQPGVVEKVEILFQSVGSAPILKQKKFKVDSTKTIDFLSSTLKRLLKLGENDSLFLYVNQAFAPSLDSVLQQLHDCYSIDGKLMIHYCTTQAWG